MAAWVRPCQGTTVAMASTGVDGIPLDDLRESAGFQGLLVDPRQGQRAPNRPTTAVHACQGIQRLQSLGLLTAAGRPEEPPRVWRASPRHRATLREDAGRHLQRIATARAPRHVTRPAVVSARPGLTGMRMVRAIVQGARAPKEWATRRDHRCKERAATIARALQGPWQPAHLCAFQQALALYDASHEQSRGCDRVIAAPLQGMALPEVPPLAPRRRVRRRQDHAGTFDARQRLHHVPGVALTAMEGLEERTALVVLRAIGTDRSRWARAKHCGSGLGLAPNPKTSGGKGPSSAPRPGVHRAAQALRLAAKHLQRRQSAWGACCRRIAARRGVAQAIPATAYKLARIVDAMLKQGLAYVAQGLEADETASRERVGRQGKRKAAALGVVVGERDTGAPPS